MTYSHYIIEIILIFSIIVLLVTVQNSSSNFLFQPISKRIYLSQFPELLAQYFLQWNLRLSNLYTHQRMGIKKGLFLGENLVVRTDTDTGKTVIAFACIFKALLKGLVGVYLVPHKRLLKDKQGELENFLRVFSAEGDPQNLAHVITISGETKPSVQELQKYRERLVIVATYEAFRSFYFEEKSRNYFQKQRWLGSVVVDESHMVYNKERGLRLETHIHRLKDEQASQFCLLSASLTKRQAIWWSKQLDAELIEAPSNRVFNYEELSIQLRAKSEGRSQIADVQAARIRGKYTQLELKKIQKVCERLRERLLQYREKSQHILIFCYARWLAREMAQAIRGQVNSEDAGIWCWCEEIHAGLSLDDQDYVFQEFLSRPSRHKILVSSPLLETGISIKDIDLIIVVDPELYSVTSLEQMCGRLRKKKSTDKKQELELNKDRKIIFVITEEFRPQIEHKFVLNESRTKILRFNIELDSWIYPDVEFTRLTMELIFRSTPGKKQILRGLRKLSYHPKYQERICWSELIPFLFSISKLFLQLGGNTSNRIAPKGISQTDLIKLLQALTVLFDWLGGHPIDKIFKDIYFTRLLKELERRELIRVSGNRGGKSALTLVGDAIVETGVEYSAALTILEYVQKSTSWSKRFIAHLVAERAAQGYTDRPDRLQKRCSSIEEFLVHYNKNDPINNFQYRKDYNIGSGDERTLRQTALWYGISLGLIYGAFHLQQSPLTPGSRSYYDREPSPLHTPLKFYQELSCFQPPEEVSYRQKPPAAPRRGASTPLDVSNRVECILERRGKNGATIREIQQEEPDLSHASIWGALDGPLASKVFKELERLGHPHRPPYRYWLRRYKRTCSWKFTCNACTHFQSNLGHFGGSSTPTHCKQGIHCENGWQNTCDQFEVPAKGNFYIYYRQHFKVAGTGSVRCPHCRHYGTIRIPSFQVACICRNCKIILKQVRSGVYHGQVVPRIFELLEGRIEDLSTTPWVKIEKYARKIYLKAGEILHVEDPRETKVAVVQIIGREETSFFRGRNNKFFFDEVEVIFLGDTTASITPSNGHQILKANGIRVERIRSHSSKKNRISLQNLLRECLLTLPGKTAFKVASNATIAKMLTSLHYSLCLLQLLPASKQGKWKEALYQQLDQLVQVRFFLEGQASSISKNINPWDCINSLRGREGAAENAAWVSIKAALPTRFQFLSRKVQRAVRSDLHSGSKARDPYNAALNGLFWELQGEAMKALEAGGFNRYYPGVGFLHRRHRRPPVIEHEKNRALIFDFIDPYRPLFRYYLLWAFQTRNATPCIEDPLEAWCLNHRFSETKDFDAIDNMWGEPIYTLTPIGEAKVKALFWRICNLIFEYEGALVPLWEIMRRNARALAINLLSFFLPSRIYSPFSILEKGEITEYCTNLTHLLTKPEKEVSLRSQEDLFADEPSSDIPSHIKEQLPHIIVPKLSFTNRFKNVIIITHVDKDGFKSALLNFIKYYYWNHPKRGKVRILTATPTSLKFVLDHEVTPLLWTSRNSQNTIIVTDFDVDISLNDQTFFQNLRQSYLQEVQNDTSQLDFHWYDHHIINPAKVTDLRQGSRTFGIQFHHDLTMETHQIIAKEIERELLFYDRILKCQVIIGGIGLFSLFFQLIRIAHHQKRTYQQKKLAEIHLLTERGEFHTHNFRNFLQIFKQLLSSQYEVQEEPQDIPHYKFPKKILEHMGKFYRVLDFEGQLDKLPRSRRPRDPLPDRKRCNPWGFYKQLRRGAHLEHLQSWYVCFEEYASGTQMRPQRSWFAFFKDLVSKKEPPPLETRSPSDPKDVLYFSKIFSTKNSVLFGVHVFQRRFSVNRVFNLLKAIHGFVPSFNFFYWSDLTLSIWASGELNLSGYLAYFGAYMHSGAGRIRKIQEKLFQIGEERILTYLYSSRTLKDCVEWSCQLEVTNKPTEFSLDEVAIIPEDTRPLREIFSEIFIPQNKLFYHLKLPLPERTPFVLYPGEMTLIYSRLQKKGDKVAADFLHHLLCVFLTQANSEDNLRPCKILVINTNIWEGQLEEIQLIRNGVSQAQLQNVLKTDPLDWPSLKNFVERFLHRIITSTQVNLIVLLRPFALIWKQFKTLDRYTRWKRYVKASADLLGSLQTIAANTGAHIIFDLNYVWGDTQNPYLPYEVLRRLRQRVFVKNNCDGFEALVQEREDVSTWLDSDTFLTAPLPWKDRSWVLAVTSGFPQGIGPKLAPDLIQKASELQPQFSEAIELASGKGLEEWEEVWGEEDDELELKTKIKVDLGLLYPEDEEKLKAPPTLHTTGYGLKFLIWQFRTDEPTIQNLPALLHHNPQERDFDLVLYANQDYYIYNSLYRLDLFETYLGAVAHPSEAQTGHAAYFPHDHSSVLPFDQFLPRLNLLFIDFHHLHSFLLKYLREYITKAPATRNVTEPYSHEQFMTANFEQLFRQLLPIFGSFPPYPPWDVPEKWEEFLRVLGQSFSWDQVHGITGDLLERIQRYYNEQKRVQQLDFDKIRDGLRKALYIPWKTKPSLEANFFPIQDQESYLQNNPWLSIIEFIPAPMCPMLPILRFVFNYYQTPEEVASFRANLPIVRLFDICLYAENWQKQRRYHIFSTVVDLSALTVFGGIGSKTNLYFKVGEDPRIPPFDAFFEQFKTLSPSEIPFQDEITFLMFLRPTIEVLKEDEVRVGLAGPPAEPPPYTKTVANHFREKIIALLTHSKPTLEELTVWIEIIRELRTYFDWTKIEDITDVIFNDIGLSMQRSADFEEEFEEAVMDGLKRGFIPEK